MTSLDFRGRLRVAELASRILPGLHLVDSFPVLSAEPVPAIAQEQWHSNSKSAISLRIDGIGGIKRLASDESHSRHSLRYTTLE